jgi:hypothetical protein
LGKDREKNTDRRSRRVAEGRADEASRSTALADQEKAVGAPAPYRFIWRCSASAQEVAPAAADLEAAPDEETT